MRAYSTSVATHLWAAGCCGAECQVGLPPRSLGSPSIKQESEEEAERCAVGSGDAPQMAQ